MKFNASAVLRTFPFVLVSLIKAETAKARALKKGIDAYVLTTNKLSQDIHNLKTPDTITIDTDAFKDQCYNAILEFVKASNPLFNTFFNLKAKEEITIENVKTRLSKNDGLKNFEAEIRTKFSSAEQAVKELKDLILSTLNSTEETILKKFLLNNLSVASENFKKISSDSSIKSISDSDFNSFLSEFSKLSPDSFNDFQNMKSKKGSFFFFLGFTILLAATSCVLVVILMKESSTDAKDDDESED